MSWSAVRCLGLVVAWLLLAPGAAAAVARPLGLAGFNVESSDAYRQTIGEQIVGVEGVDLWGFTEVWNESWAEEFTSAAGVARKSEFSHRLGTSGGDDRLLVVFNSRRLRLLAHYELEDIRKPRRAAPLVAHFRVDGRSEFLFVVAQLSLKDRDRRMEADGLNAWARGQKLPVVMVGSFNFDWELEEGDRRHDEAYDLLTAGEVFRWLRPGELIATECGHRGRVQDFVFMAGAARGWAASSEILFPQSNYCPDTQTTSDHRPVLARLAFGAGTGPSSAARRRLHRYPRSDLQRLRRQLHLQLPAPGRRPTQRYRWCPQRPSQRRVIPRNS